MEGVYFLNHVRSLQYIISGWHTCDAKSPKTGWAPPLKAPKKNQKLHFHPYRRKKTATAPIPPPENSRSRPLEKNPIQGILAGMKVWKGSQF